VRNGTSIQRSRHRPQKLQVLPMWEPLQNLQSLASVESSLLRFFISRLFRSHHFHPCHLVPRFPFSPFPFSPFQRPPYIKLLDRAVHHFTQWLTSPIRLLAYKLLTFRASFCVSVLYSLAVLWPSSYILTTLSYSFDDDDDDDDWKRKQH